MPHPATDIFENQSKVLPEEQSPFLDIQKSASHNNEFATILGQGALATQKRFSQ